MVLFDLTIVGLLSEVQCFRKKGLVDFKQKVYIDNPL